ncbi:hypothetical protein GCM10027203_32480 [Nonomuraea fastidiosa]
MWRARARSKTLETPENADEVVSAATAPPSPADAERPRLLGSTVTSRILFPGFRNFFVIWLTPVRDLSVDMFSIYL